MGEVVQSLLSTLNELGPTTAGELFDRAGLKLTPARVRELAKAAPVFIADLSKTAVAAKAFVGVPGKVAEALESDGLLLSLLELPHVKGNKTRAHTQAQLQAMVAKPFRADWASVLNQRFAMGKWPSGVGGIRSRSSALVMLLNDIVRNSAASQAEIAMGDTSDASMQGQAEALRFEALFEDAFLIARKRRRTPLVELSELRRMLPQYAGRDFDQGLRALRERSQRYVLETFDGRHGQISAEVRDGGIAEGGNLYVYVARRAQ